MEIDKDAAKNFLAKKRENRLKDKEAILPIKKEKGPPKITPGMKKAAVKKIGLPPGQKPNLDKFFPSQQAVPPPAAAGPSISINFSPPQN